VRRFRGEAALPAALSHRRELLVLAGAAMLMPLIQWVWTNVHGNFNDFHDYWLAGKLVLAGQSPYDIGALRALAKTEHLSFLVGGGYSYPLPFAVFMVPFAMLPFTLSLELFVGLSIALFGRPWRSGSVGPTAGSPPSLDAAWPWPLSRVSTHRSSAPSPAARPTCCCSRCWPVDWPWPSPRRVLDGELSAASFSVSRP